MIIGKYTIAARTIALVVGLVALVILAMWVPSCLQKQRSQRAQARTDAAQAAAQESSAADAIGVVTAAGERETASEALTRANERDIRAAEGAGDKVKPGVANAGLAALCKRAVYKNEPRCAPFRKEVR